jgi:YHYH protein
MRIVLVALAYVVLSTAYAWAHEEGTPSEVTITELGDKRIIEANGLPDHEPGRFPNRGNPNEIGAQHYRFEMPLKPRANNESTPVERFIFGIAVNGVVFDPGTAEVWVPGERIVSRPGPGTRRPPGPPRDDAWNYDGMGTMNLGLDAHHAHVQPNGAYHYHGLPVGLIKRLQKDKGDSAMLLVGYAADGFPIYAESGHAKADDASTPVKKLRSSYRLKTGKRPTGDEGPGGKYDGTFVQDYEFVAEGGDLDECNGREGVTPEYPDGTYYYVLTETFPFVPRYFRGDPDNSFERRRPGPGGPGGRPPRRRR